MIVCPACKTSNVENTLFCTECGTYLPEGETQTTDAVGINLSDFAPEADVDGDTPAKTLGTGPLAINLEIVDPRREIQLPLSKPIHMGRLDPSANVFPEVDLTNDGGAEKGVSRRHARIMKRDQRVYVEDLGSSNGTFVNDQKLMPYFPEELAHGDSLKLGKLEIRVILANGR